MRSPPASFSMSLLCAVAACAPDAGTPQTQVEAAARRALPDVTWQAASMIAGDFSCKARPEYAILGRADGDAVVAVFAAGETAPIGVVRLATARAPTLSRDDLDFERDDFEREVGPLPEGLFPSKTCNGLLVSDPPAAPVHVYWNRKANRFDRWSR